MRLHRCRDQQLDDAQLETEVCSKHWARSPFALQLQRLRLDVQPVQAPVEQLVLVQVERRAQVRAQVEQLVLELEPAQVQVQAVQQVPAQAQQPHSPHQQLQSQCQPELCRLH